MNRDKIILGTVLMVFAFGVEVMSLTMSYPVYGIIQYANGSHPSSVSITLTDTRTSETINLDTFGSSYDPVDGLFMLDMAQLPSGYEDGDGIQVDIDDGYGYGATVMGMVDTSDFGTDLGNITLTMTSTTTTSTTTTTTSTSTTSTTTTIPGNPADTNSDGRVDDFELLAYIDLWAKGLVDDFDLLNAIAIWAKG